MIKKSKRPTYINIRVRDLFLTITAVIGVYFLFYIKDLIIGLFISLLIATALNPLVDKLESYKLPRPLAIILIYILIIVSIVFLGSTVIPPLVVQTAKFLESFPINNFTKSIEPLEVNLENIHLITSQLGSFAPLIRVVTSTFSWLVTFFTFAVITFYTLMERKNLHRYLVSILGNNHDESRMESIVDNIELKIGSWVRGQIALMFVVGLVTYIGLFLLGIPFALPLAIIAGLLEIIPNIGPTVSAIPAIIVPLITDQDPIMAVFVIALYILVQQLENNLIVPKIMQSATGIHPLITIILIIVGFKLTGVSGAILAIPFFLVSKVVITEIIRYQDNK